VRQRRTCSHAGGSFSLLHASFRRALRTRSRAIGISFRRQRPAPKRNAESTRASTRRIAVRGCSRAPTSKPLKLLLDTSVLAFRQRRTVPRPGAGPSVTGNDVTVGNGWEMGRGGCYASLVTKSVQATQLPELLSPDRWSDRSVAEHARGLESACATAMQIIASTPEGRERLLRLDPVPASTIRIIRRMAQLPRRWAPLQLRRRHRMDWMRYVTPFRFAYAPIRFERLSKGQTKA
jgi:hypothetical protein